MSNKPIASLNDLVTQESGEELIVYNPHRNEAHCLNPVAAYVLHHCDGIRTVSEIAAGLSREIDFPEDESLVWQALDELSEANLVTIPVEELTSTGAARRNLMKTAIAMVMVQSILLPTPAAADTLGLVINIWKCPTTNPSC